MIFFPAIDIIEGKCVRLRQGDFGQQTNYQTDPLELALSWQDQGATHLHLVDLDGAKSGSTQNIELLRKICSKTKLKVDFGGGLKTQEAVDSALEAGAQKVNLGSIAINDPDQFEVILDKYSENLILSLDLKDNFIAVNGWQQNSALKAAELLQKYQTVKFVSVTDISKDGTLEGPNFDLYSELIEQFPQTCFIASGGISCLDDLVKLKESGLYGSIAGKAILENKFTVAEAMKVVRL